MDKLEEIKHKQELFKKLYEFESIEHIAKKIREINVEISNLYDIDICRFSTIHQIYNVFNNYKCHFKEEKSVLRDLIMNGYGDCYYIDELVNIEA